MSGDSVDARYSTFTDKELLDLWQLRVTRLTDAIEASTSDPLVWPDHQHEFLNEAIDRVEREMARRNMPIPGDKTWK
jgi:hypothetical protein